MANLTTLNETLRSPIDGTEFVRLATPGQNWKVPLGSITRLKSTANINFYISTTGSDVTGDGSAGNPWATPQHAADTIGQNIDLNSFTAFVNMADGSYVGPVINFYSSALGNQIFPTGGGIHFIGHVGDNTKVTWTINSNGFSVFDTETPCNIYVDWVTLSPSTSSVWGFTLDSNFSFIVFNNCRFAAPVGGSNRDCVITFNANSIIILNAIEIVGNWNSVLKTSNNGPQVSVQFLGQFILTGTPAWAEAFVSIADLSQAFGNVSGFTGTATGKRYSAVSNGVIDTNGGGANYFPGNVAGTTATGGQYL